MNRQKLVRDLESALGVAVGVVLSQQTSHLAKSWFPVPGVTAAFSIIVIAVAIVVIRFFAGSLFVRSRVLRRILMGNQYVEGTWFDIMRKNGEVAEIGFSRIIYTRAGVKFFGEDYALTMENGFPYRAELVQIEWPKLKYVYTANRSDSADEVTTGYGILDFLEERHGPPKKYSGKYFVLRGTDTVSFEGIRLHEKHDKDLIHQLDDPLLRKQALSDLLEKYDG